MKTVSGWWRAMFPAPVTPIEAECRAVAIGAFWGLVVGIPLVVALTAWLATG